MDLVFYPDPVLQRRADPVPDDFEGLFELANGMLQLMVKENGVGLAAPQVGRSLRVFVASKTGDPKDGIVAINPKVTPYGSPVPQEEGCLSLPGLRYEVMRPESVRIAYRSVDGKQHEAEYDGLMARIIQHEYDHLEGVLFIERLSEADRLRARQDLAALEEQAPG